MQAAQNIDTGMGLERVAQILQGVANNYETDLIFPLLAEAARLAGVDYATADERTRTSLKVIGDHTRACVYLISDGVTPSNIGRGYVLRRLIRRVVLKVISLLTCQACRPVAVSFSLPVNTAGLLMYCPCFRKASVSVVYLCLHCYTSICLFAKLPLYSAGGCWFLGLTTFVCLSVSLSVSLSICMSVCLCVRLSVCLPSVSASLSLSLSVCLSTYLHVVYLCAGIGAPLPHTERIITLCTCVRMVQGRLLGISDTFTPAIARVAIQLSGGCDTAVVVNQERILTELAREEERFTATLETGVPFQKAARCRANSHGKQPTGRQKPMCIFRPVYFNRCVGVGKGRKRLFLPV